jgi:hypothetical protein
MEPPVLPPIQTGRRRVCGRRTGPWPAVLRFHVEDGARLELVDIDRVRWLARPWCRVRRSCLFLAVSPSRGAAWRGEHMRLTAAGRRCGACT